MMDPTNVSIYLLSCNGEMSVYHDLRNKEHLIYQVKRNLGIFIDSSSVM